MLRNPLQKGGGFVKKLSRIAAVSLMAISIVLAARQACGNEPETIAHGKQPISIFFKDFSNESGQPQIIPAEFMNEIRKAFVERRSVSFVIAKTLQDSDMVVSAAIKSYQYLEKDPVKPSLSFIMALDAATTENFAEISADFTVTDAKNGSVLWKETVTSYVKKMMTPAQSLPLVYDKLARHFVSKAFGRGD
jgi:hypothetical protein